MSRLVGNFPASARALFDARSTRWFTYSELETLVASTASVLRFPRKALAFCFCQNRIESVVAYLACLEAGHAVLLLDPALNVEFSRKLVDLYRPDFVLAPTDSDVLGATLNSNDFIESQLSGLSICQVRRPHCHDLHPDLALLLSTSGSTGSPKLVRLSLRNIKANADSIIESLGINAEERAISSLPLYYSYGLSVINSHLRAGATVVLTGDGLTSADSWNTMRSTECTSFAGVPYMYQVLARLKVDSLNLPKLKTMTQAGGKLTNDLVKTFHGTMCRRSGRFFVMYGQTEATARICVLPHEAFPKKLGSCGKPIPGTSVTVVQDGIPVSEPMSSGELVCSGPNVMMGYASTSSDLALGDTQGGRLETGDLGYLDRDGFVFITGRMKRFSKLFGIRINLDEVETMLKSRGPTAVIEGDDRLLIFCEYGESADFEAYKQELATKLSLHPKVFDFRRVEQLPLTSNGKPDYLALAV